MYRLGKLSGSHAFSGEALKGLKNGFISLFSFAWCISTTGTFFKSFYPPLLIFKGGSFEPLEPPLLRTCYHSARSAGEISEVVLSRKPEVALTNLPQGSVPLNNTRCLESLSCLLSISHIPLVYTTVALCSSGTVTLIEFCQFESTSPCTSSFHFYQDHDRDYDQFNLI